MLKGSKNLQQACLYVIQSREAALSAKQSNDIEIYLKNGQNALLMLKKPQECFEFLANVEHLAPEGSKAYQEAVQEAVDYVAKSKKLIESIFVNKKLSQRQE